MMDATQTDTPPWPLRAWALAVVGGAGGVAIHWLLDGGSSDEPLRQGLATFLIVGLLAFGHAWTRGRLLRALAIGAVAGAIIALVFLWNGTPTGEWSSGQSWRIVAALVTAAIFLPLAQAYEDGGSRTDGRQGRRSIVAVRDAVQRRFPYPVVHGHAWTNLLIVGLSVLFAGAFFLMLLLMGELFGLIGVRQLSDILKNDPVIAAIWGAAIGASTGLLRDRHRVIASLQAVAMTVLRVAAPVLAVSLALFLAILPLTGLAPLWDATRATTPILLSAVIVALLLANSVIGDGGEDEARAPVLRLAALVLAVVVTPLAVIAAVSTGLRVAQYGWTPERLWAATFVGMACVVAVACLIAVVRGRGRWADGLRAMNLWLAFLICGVALLLSTPLVRFDGIATRDQMARLADGRTKADKFDYSALWFSFGPEGKVAIRWLEAEGATAEIRRRARDIRKARGRLPELFASERQLAGAALDRRLTILPRRVPIEQALRERLIQYDLCDKNLPCLLVYEPEADHAVAVALPFDGCDTCLPVIRLIRRGGGDWQIPAGLLANRENRAIRDRMVEAIRAGRMEVRDVRWRQLFIDGQPYGDPIPPENSAVANRSP